MPESDSNWKRGLLWPALGRLRSGGDRERLVEDEAPVSCVSALFPLGALFNHSCEPNVGYSECGWAEGAPAPRVVFRAARAIAAGDAWRTVGPVEDT